MHEKLTGKRPSSPLTARLTALLFTPSINLQNLTCTFSILSKYFANPSPVRNFLLAKSQALQITCGLSFLMHGFFTLSDATSYDKIEKLLAGEKGTTDKLYSSIKSRYHLGLVFYA